MCWPTLRLRKRQHLQIHKWIKPKKKLRWGGVGANVAERLTSLIPELSPQTYEVCRRGSKSLEVEARDRQNTWCFTPIQQRRVMSGRNKMSCYHKYNSDSLFMTPSTMNIWEVCEKWRRVNQKGRTSVGWSPVNKRSIANQYSDQLVLERGNPW